MAKPIKRWISNCFGKCKINDLANIVVQYSKPYIKARLCSNIPGTTNIISILIRIIWRPYLQGIRVEPLLTIGSFPKNKYLSYILDFSKA